MNAQNNSNSMGSANPASWIIGTGIIPQLILALVLSILLYIMFMSVETIYKSYIAVNATRINLLSCTANSQDKAIQFEQNPNERNHKTLPFSDNERTGAEFSYSFYLWINPSSFERQEEGLTHVMHKGYSSPFPLMSPGVFLLSNINTMRVYMNSSKTWNNYIDIENIPVKKWVHVTLVGRANAVEIYINGNLAKKLNMDQSVFYQNFGNLYLFNQRRLYLNPVKVLSLTTQTTPLQIFGAFNGNMSALSYFSYALSFTEIQSLVSSGPKSGVCDANSSSNQPPYLEDNWWVTKYTK